MQQLMSLQQDDSGDTLKMGDVMLVRFGGDELITFEISSR
jgi:hypothetical protein